MRAETGALLTAMRQIIAERSLRADRLEPAQRRAKRVSVSRMAAAGAVTGEHFIRHRSALPGRRRGGVVFSVTAAREPFRDRGLAAQGCLHVFGDGPVAGVPVQQDAPPEE